MQDAGIVGTSLGTINDKICNRKIKKFYTTLWHRETRLPSNIERKEKSRISLILEENPEEDDLKLEIDKLMAKMSTDSVAKKVGTYANFTSYSLYLEM